MNSMDEYVVLAARTFSGLLAGLYFAYAVSVMPALKAMDDTTFVTVMNRINVVIVNPLFLTVFLGAPAACVALLFWEQDALTIATAVLGVVTLLVTVVFNIPLNNALAAGGSRDGFERPWVLWNAVRTLTGIACLVCVLLV